MYIYVRKSLWNIAKQKNSEDDDIFGVQNSYKNRKSPENIHVLWAFSYYSQTVTAKPPT